MITTEQERQVEKTVTPVNSVLVYAKMQIRKKRIAAVEMGTFRPCYCILGPFLTLSDTKQNPSEVNTLIACFFWRRFF